MENYLSVIGNGTFATVRLPPALSIHDLGGIGLPLSERDAHAVRKIYHETPFGKGNDQCEEDMGA